MQPRAYTVPPIADYGSPEWKAKHIERAQMYRTRLVEFAGLTVGLIAEAFPQVTPQTAANFRTAFAAVLCMESDEQIATIQSVEPPPAYDADRAVMDLIEEREQLTNQIEAIERILTGQSAKVADVPGLRELFEVMEQVALTPLRSKVAKLDATIGRSHMNESVNATLQSSEQTEEPLYPQKFAADELMPDSIEELRRRGLGLSPTAPPLKRDGIGEV